MAQDLGNILVRYDHPAKPDSVVAFRGQLSAAPSQSFSIAVRQYNRSYGSDLKGNRAGEFKAGGGGTNIGSL